MVPRQAFCNKIREFGYVFKAEKRRTYLYRKKNGLSYIAVPTSNFLDEDFVAGYLRREGLDEDQIRRFMAEAKT
jgi:hypothetical protein